MNDLDHKESLSTLSESSFVILNQGSLPHSVNDDLNKIENSNSLSTNKNFTDVYEITNSNRCDNFQSEYQNENSLSEKEIHKKLIDLTKENSHLKETLNQNNLAIKSQLDTFIMWQQEVLKTHETHKQKFLETKELILKLRAENKCLKKHFEESSGIKDLNGCDLNTLINKTPESLHKPYLKIEEYKDLIEKNENLDAENQKLKEELRASQNEILKLNKKLEDIGRENKFLNYKSDSFEMNSFGNVSYKSLPGCEAKVQVTNLFKMLEVERGKVLKLTKELEQTKANDSEALLLKLPMTDKLDQYFEKLSNVNDSFDNQNERYSGLSNWMSLAEQNLKENKIKADDKGNLVSDIKQLKSHLNKEEVIFRENQECLAKLKNQFYLLLEDYKALQVKLTSLKNRDSNYEKLHKDLSTVITKLEIKDKELILKQQEIDDLKKTVEKLNLESQEMAVLKVQVQIYQSDFNLERAAREKLAEEKEKMSKQIRLLQSRIIALERENFEEDNSNKSSLETPGKKTKYVCPRCLISFPDIIMLEIHLEECFIDDFF